MNAIVRNARGPAVSRRGLIGGGTALVFAVGMSGLNGVFSSAHADPGKELEANVWVRIAADDTVTIVFPMTEMGQGSSSALPLILAEELDADWDKVRVDQLDRDDRAYGNRIFGGLLYTAGSTAVMAYFDPLRKAGAQARRVLMTLAAGHWNVPVEELQTEPGVVLHRQSGKRLRYGQIVAMAQDRIDVPEIAEADLKPRSEYRLIGKDVPRKDIPAKSTGRETYAIDVRVPGMVYAAVLRSPVEGEEATELQDSEARSLPGVVDVVRLPDGIAVVAERLEAAFAARDQLAVQWSETSDGRAFSSESDLEGYARAAGDDTQSGPIWSARGDANGAIANADLTLERDYLSDYAYHAQMEPMAVVASVEPDGKGAEVWAGTQTQTWTTRTIIDVLGTTPDRIKLHMMTMGGSFGRRTALVQEYVRDALLASKAVGKPVKVVWTREDDLKHGWFRPAAAQRLRGGLTADGELSGWYHRVATPSVIAHFNPARWKQVEPKDIISMRGSENPFYGIEHLTAEHIVTERRARIIPWRAIGASYTAFAAECFMDELAEAAGTDPVSFRLKLLGQNPRGRHLIERVTEMAGWPNSGSEESALGLSFAGYGSSMAAGIAEVTVDRSSGVISVPRFWAAVDAGLIISPNNALAQVEGGIVYGLSSALKERVTIADGQVEQSNFYDYEILRANETPEIEIQVADAGAPPTGVGELGTPMVPAAVANAFFALTGRRLRHMPFTPDRVLAALS